MNFNVHSERLVILHEFCSPKKIKRIAQKRFQIVNESMRMKSVNKTQFSGLNIKKYYFYYGIVSLPIGWKRRLEKKGCSKLHTEVKKEMYKFLELEGKEVHLCEELRILRSIYSQPPMLYQFSSCLIATFVALKNTRELIINGSWK